MPTATSINHVKSGTIADVLRYLAPRTPRGGLIRLIDWAPDVFAVTAYLLHKTGAYHHALNYGSWAKLKKAHGQKRLTHEQMQHLGHEWRKRMDGGQRPPSPVSALWRRIMKHRALSLDKVYDHLALVALLLDLTGCADAACEGLGLPASPPSGKSHLIASDLLVSSHLGTGASTLCQHITPSTLCVLPKLHTPQIGMTIRSLTHHLAMWPRDELCPVWPAELLNGSTTREEGGLNVLLVPYPYTLETAQFKDPGINMCGMHKMADGFRFVRFEPESARNWLKNEFPRLLRKAQIAAPGGRIDAVVFPELSLKNSQEVVLAAEILLEISPHAFLVAGATNGRQNTAQLVIPFPIETPDEKEQFVLLYEQAKHHRWQLDKWQIEQYGLQGQLPPGNRYWEDTAFSQRSIYCFPLKRSLTLSVLICEDLARQEPAARLIRAIGPNLVIALLMDGEQDSRRWSGRYAGVLGEDPGSSVLTLTSRGMIDLQRKAAGKKAASQMCIGLWRDSMGGSARELRMEKKSSALLLCLSTDKRLEYSVDGRSFNTPVLRLTDHLPDGKDAIKQIRL